MVEVSKAAAGALAQQVRIGRHFLIADVDAPRGGDDLGPDAHDLLDAALAVCTALTLRMYAQRKGIALEDVIVDVEHSGAPGLTTLTRRIRIVGEVAPAVRARLLEIADRCPVHKALSGRFDIVTRAVD